VRGQSETVAGDWAVSIRVTPKWSSAVGDGDQFDREPSATPRGVIWVGVVALIAVLSAGLIGSLTSPEEVAKPVQGRATVEYGAARHLGRQGRTTP
jgi:hypothetical protein